MNRKLFPLLLTIVSLLFSCEGENIFSNEDLNIEFSGTTIAQITSNSVQLSCNIKNNKQALDGYGFCIDKSKDPTLSSAEIKQELSGANTASSESINIGSTISSLDAAVQYYVRPYVKIGSNVNYGQTVSFRTLAKNSGTGEVQKLPIVFHIVYSDKSNPNENILASTIKTIVDNCNAMLRNTYPNASGIDTKIELSLAQYDNKGALMIEHGIDRVESTTSQYDTKYFAESRKESITEMWDPASYINIWVFTFPETNIVGQSYIAYSSDANPLAGLVKGDFYFYNRPTYAHGVYMSNRYISNLNVFSQSLTHEIGHYLGLFHVFEVKKGSTCDITNDYCDDTKTYNRVEYEKQLQSLTVQNRYLRTDCQTSKTYEAKNYMDYDYCRFTTFTPSQIARMHHVLKYSPLVPGATPVKSTKRSDYPKPKARMM